MNPFEEAARKAADSIVEFIRIDLDSNPNRFQSVESEYAIRDIARLEVEKHFANLRATYDALVLLAVATKAHIRAGGNEGIFVVEELLNNPLVQSAIERSKG